MTLRPAANRDAEETRIPDLFSDSSRASLRLLAARQPYGDGLPLEVTLPLEDQAGVSAARQALDEVDRLEDQLTIFRESSEVSLINREAAAAPVCVEQSLFSLLLLCRELCRETGGAFDITSGPLSRCWGFLRRQGRIPEPGEIEEAKALVGEDKLFFDCESRAIRFARPGVEINLGSVGKGYALDRIAAIMRRRVRAALLSAGSSSILAVGGVDGGWTVRRSPPRRQREALRQSRGCATRRSRPAEARNSFRIWRQTLRPHH